ncbi:MAG: cation:proton antiporter [Bacteroidota bacterium]
MMAMMCNDGNAWQLLAIFSHFDYLPLLVVVAVAWLTPLLMSLLRLRRIPTVIMEIVVGFLIGKFLFTYFTPESTEVLDFLAFTGFMFLMFLSGLEIDVDQIVASFPRRRITLSRYLSNPLLVGFTIFLLTVTLSYGGALILGIFILFFIFYLSGILLKRIPLIQKLTFQLSEAASQITIRGTMLILLIFIVVAQFIGRDPV